MPFLGNFFRSNDFAEFLFSLLPIYLTISKKRVCFFLILITFLEMLLVEKGKKVGKEFTLTFFENAVSEINLPAQIWAATSSFNDI